MTPLPVVLLLCLQGYAPAGAYQQPAQQGYQQTVGMAAAAQQQHATAAVLSGINMTQEA